MAKAPFIYAIDFGTTNSLLGAAEPNQLHAPIVLDPTGPDPTILRSVLYFPSMKECFYGSSAIKEFVARDMEGRLIRSIKKYLPIRSFIGTFIDERPMNLEDILGYFLREMRKRANEHFKQDITSAVIGRPARFSQDKSDDQFAQYRLEKAAKNAGFEHIEFCPEPIAAAYEFRQTITEPKIVLVADFGGGTSDFTVVKISKQNFQDSDVLALGGVAIAGDALDGAIMKNKISTYFGADVSYTAPFGSNILKMPTHLMEKICSPADISLLRKRDTMEFLKNVKSWSLGENDREKMNRLFRLLEDQLGFQVFEAIERTKRALSSSDETYFEFSYPEVEIKEKVSRKNFDDFTADRVSKILGSLDQTIQDAQLKFADIDVVCCTGGTAKVPVIHNALVSRFGLEKVRERNAFHSVAQGLIVKAQELLHK